MRELQYCNGGDWIDAGEKTDGLLKRAENYTNNHPNKIALLDGFETITDKLNAGKRVHIGTDWDAMIRYKPAAREPIAVELVKCDCGHTVPRIQVMNTSTGTSCPDCYDRMSM
jgi:hypothetical protein